MLLNLGVIDGLAIRCAFALIGSMIHLSLYGQVVEAGEDFRYTRITTESRYYHDTSGWDIEQIVSLPTNYWSQVDEGGFSSNSGEFSYWLKFDLHSAISQNVYLEIDFVTIDSLLLYVAHDDYYNTYENVGDVVDPNDRPIQFRLPCFKIELDADQVYSVYLYALKDKSLGALPLKLYSESAFIDRVARSENHIGIVYGILCMSIIIAFLTAAFFRSKTYLLYGCFVCTLLIFLMSSLGSGYFYIWGDVDFLNSFITYFASIFSAYFFGAFFQSSVNLAKIWPKLNYVFNIVKTYYLLAAVITIGVNIFPIMDVLASIIKWVHYSIILFPLFITAVGILVYAKLKIKKSLLIVITFQISLSAMILLPLIPTGLVSRHLYEIYKWLFTIEIFIILLILLHDLLSVKNKQIALQSELIAVRQKAVKNFLKGEQKERRRFANELHDNLGLKLATIKMDLSNNPTSVTAPYIEGVLDSLTSDIRRISHALSPVTLHRRGLIAALEEEIFKIESTDLDMVISFRYPDDMKKIEDEKVQFFYFSFLELMQNILKHSRATEIEIQLEKQGDLTTMTIIDDGVNYDPNSSEGSGIGLYNIQSRVGMLDGSFDVIPRKGGGMIHRVTI